MVWNGERFGRERRKEQRKEGKGRTEEGTHGEVPNEHDTNDTIEPA